MKLAADDPRAVAVVGAIHRGDTDALRALLAADATLARAWIVAPNGVERSLLHIATDWPGHFPHGANPAWLGHDGLTPRDAAARAGATEVLAWLE